MRDPEESNSERKKTNGSCQGMGGGEGLLCNGYRGVSIGEEKVLRIDGGYGPTTMNIFNATELCS